MPSFGSSHEEPPSIFTATTEGYAERVNWTRCVPGWVLGTSCETAPNWVPSQCAITFGNVANKFTRGRGYPDPDRTAFWRENKALVFPKGSYFGADSHTGKLLNRPVTWVAPTEVLYACLRAVTVGNIRASFCRGRH